MIEQTPQALHTLPQVVHTLPYAINTYPDIFEKLLYGLIGLIFAVLVYIWRMTIKHQHESDLKITELEHGASKVEATIAVFTTEIKNIKDLLESIQQQNIDILKMSNARLERLSRIEERMKIPYKDFYHGK